MVFSLAPQYAREKGHNEKQLESNPCGLLLRAIARDSHHVTPRRASARRYARRSKCCNGDEMIATLNFLIKKNVRITARKSVSEMVKSMSEMVVVEFENFA